ncbi:hypothetical protein [Shinella sumterensis]|uniref:hypothetical protein n=1 Tax=Shinella sumterensis TaxID=1967501 RepID=UPI003F825FA4
MSNLSTSAPIAVPFATLCEIADESDFLLGAALEASDYPDENVYSTVEGGTFGALITAARDLHFAALAIATGKGLASEEVLSALRNAEGAVTLVAQYAEQGTRKLSS